MESSDKCVIFISLAIDSKGNSYIAGANSGGGSSVNSDGSVTNFDTKAYCLTKYNANGLFAWSVGSKSPGYGSARSIYLKDESVYSTGYIKDQNKISTFIMTSTDGNNVSIPFHSSEFFIARHDTCWCLKRV